MSSRTIVREVKRQAAGGGGLGGSTVLSWQHGTSIPIKPEVVDGELKRIHTRYGAVDAHLIVRDAEPPESPLHPAFEWDDSTAAREYRLRQAGYLTRAMVLSVRRTDGTLTNPVRAWVSVTRASVDGSEDDEDANPLFTPRVYVPVTTVVTEEDARRRYVLRAYEELQHWRNRYKDIAAFAHIFEEIERLSAVVSA